MHFAPDERVEQIQHWLEEQTFRSRCVDEDTNEWLAHATLSTSHGEVLDKRSRLNERSVHDGDILLVILWAAVGPTFVCEWSNGIRVGPAPPLPREGCYVRQLIRKVWQNTKLPWYAETRLMVAYIAIFRFMTAWIAALSSALCMPSWTPVPRTV